MKVITSTRRDAASTWARKSTPIMSMATLKMGATITQSDESILEDDNAAKETEMLMQPKHTTWERRNWRNCNRNPIARVSDSADRIKELRTAWQRINWKRVQDQIDTKPVELGSAVAVDAHLGAQHTCKMTHVTLWNWCTTWHPTCTCQRNTANKKLSQLCV